LHAGYLLLGKILTESYPFLGHVATFGPLAIKKKMHFAKENCFGCALALLEYGCPTAHKIFINRFKRYNQFRSRKGFQAD